MRARLRSILVVEDNPLARDWFTTVLASLTEKIVVASDGREAFGILRTETGIDVVVSHLDLPTMNGIEVLSYARAAGIQVPFVFVTATPASIEVSTLAKHFGAPILQKPVSPDALVERVRSICPG